MRDVKYCRHIGRLSSLSADGTLMLWDAQLGHVRTVRLLTVAGSGCDKDCTVRPQTNVKVSKSSVSSGICRPVRCWSCCKSSTPYSRPSLSQEPSQAEHWTRLKDLLSAQSRLKYDAELVCLAMDANSVAVGSQSHVTLVDARKKGAVQHIDCIDSNCVRLFPSYHAERHACGSPVLAVLVT